MIAHRTPLFLLQFTSTFCLITCYSFRGGYRERNSSETLVRGNQRTRYVIHSLHFSSQVEINDESEDQDYIDEDWLPDREKVKRAKRMNGDPRREHSSRFGGEIDSGINSVTEPKIRKTYTSDEEELIDILGGKIMDHLRSKREPGFLGDSTMKEVAHDFQVPIPYLADVLCTWGVPAPIDCDTPLGDMVTGEQCFAILEAIHTLDVGALNDRYSNMNLMSLCEEYGIDLKDAFQLAIKANWNLPFGVKTYLRVEQEEELIRALAPDEAW